MAKAPACCALVVLLGLAVGAHPAGAQSPPSGAVLTGDQVTEQSITDQLTPHQTRQLKIVRDGAGGSPVVAPPPSVNLLITFTTNSTLLTDKAREQLDVVGRAINGERLGSMHFIIEGHADARGNSSANMALSLARAQAVRTYLVKSAGVEEMRLRAVGKGDGEPLNREDVAAPENRRVTFITEMP